MPMALLRVLTQGLRRPTGSRAKNPAPATTSVTEPAPANPSAPLPEVAAIEGLKCDHRKNQVTVGENIELVGEIRGSGNVVEVGPTRTRQRLVLSIYGNNNRVIIGRQALLAYLRIDIGAGRWPAEGASLSIGEFFSVGSRSRIMLPNSGNIVKIGDRCMFSNNIMVRGGEYPHLILDKETGRNLDVSDGIFIGDHAWIGEGAFLGKSSTIPSECIVGARSVVTKRFDVENAVIAGNPAKIVKTGVQWVANEIYLEEHPALKAGYEQSKLNRVNRPDEGATASQPIDQG